MSRVLRFEGCQSLRHRLVLATLSGRAVRIDNIRSRSENPGLRDFEANLLRLLEKITDGCLVEINETGTTLRYRPGQIVGGTGLVHDCGTARAMSYYIEVLFCLGIFAREPLEITLKGVTDGPLDPGIDVTKNVTLPLLRAVAGLGPDGSALGGDLRLNVRRRGPAPLGGGEVSVSVPVLASLPPVSLLEEGLVKRVRGVAFSTRVPPALAPRMIDAARGVLNHFLADVFIFKDHSRASEAGAAPGYGLSLVAETVSGRLLGAEASCLPSTKEAAAEEAVRAEDVGQQAAQALLQEIQHGGVCDSAHQALLLLLCAAGPAELNQVRLGPLTPQAVAVLRHIRDILGVTFSIKPEPASRTIFLQCVGAGIRNLARGLR